MSSGRASRLRPFDVKLYQLVSVFAVVTVVVSVCIGCCYDRRSRKSSRGVLNESVLPPRAWTERDGPFFKQLGDIKKKT